MNTYYGFVSLWLELDKHTASNIICPALCRAANEDEALGKAVTAALKAHPDHCVKIARMFRVPDEYLTKPTPTGA